MVIDDERPKLKAKLKRIEIEGLLDSVADESIISQESWDPNWPVQKSPLSYGYWNLISGKPECRMD